MKSRPFCQRLYVIIFCIPTSSTTEGKINVLKIVFHILVLCIRICLVPLLVRKRFSVGSWTVSRHKDHGKASETQRHKGRLFTLSRKSCEVIARSTLARGKVVSVSNQKV